jgi:hypothetical protein
MAVRICALFRCTDGPPTSINAGTPYIGTNYAGRSLRMVESEVEEPSVAHHTHAGRITAIERRGTLGFNRCGLRRCTTARRRNVQELQRPSLGTRLVACVGTEAGSWYITSIYHKRHRYERIWSTELLVYYIKDGTLIPGRAARSKALRILFFEMNASNAVQK